MASGRSHSAHVPTRQLSSGRQALAQPLVRNVLCSSGSPLPSTTLAWAESRFGHDFSKVRVHADSRAAASAELLHAQAYAVGDHLVFDQQLYSPESAKGRQLLAHELAHVLQQSGTGATGSALEVDSSRQCEVEADSIAKAAAASSSVTPLAISRARGLQRKEALGGAALTVSFDGEFLVQDQNGAWFHCGFTCFVDGRYSTAIDEVRIGPYAKPARFIPNVATCTYGFTPLEEYRLQLKRQRDLQMAMLLQQMNSKRASGALAPVYIEFDLLMLGKDPSLVSRFFTAFGIASNIVDGDYEGGLISAIEDKAYGLVSAAIAKKLWKAVYKVPPGASEGKKLELIEGLIGVGLEKGVGTVTGPPPRAPK